MAAAMVVVLLFFAQVIWSIWGDYQDTLETEYEHLGIRVRLTEARLSGSFRSLDLLLRALSERRSKDSTAPVDSFRHELENSLGLTPEISGLFATDAQGIVNVNTEPALEGYDSAQREYFKHHAGSTAGDSGLLVSKPFKGASGRQVFTLSRAMRSPRGEFMGVIVARFEINTFAELFRPMVPPETGALTLLFTDGDVLFRWPEPERFIGRNFRNGAAFAEHMASGETETRHRIFAITDGVERIAVFRYDGRVSCVSNVCQHQNGPLGEGKIVDGCITCPWHGYQYLPDSGQSPPPFTEKIPTFNVRIRAGRVLVHRTPNPPGTRVEPATIPS